MFKYTLPGSYCNNSTNCMHHIPWKYQDISRFLWNPEVHDCVHSSPLLVSIMTYVDPVHIFISCTFSIHSNYILPSKPRLLKWYLPFRSLTKIWINFSPLPCFYSCPVHRCFCIVTFMTSKVWVVFEVLTAVCTKMAVFWVVAPYGLVEIYQRFRGPSCLRHQGDDKPLAWNRFQM
jgi:hypothetical protein